MDLNQLIEDVRGSGVTGPHEIAREVMMRIDGRDLRASLAETLPVYVRWRLRALRLPPASAIRDMSRFLEDAHYVDGVWKRAADMTAEDCRWLADDYSKRADGNGDRANAWFDLARLLDQRPVRTVGKLQPEEIVTALTVRS